jgi:hypothetical protein
VSYFFRVSLDYAIVYGKKEFLRTALMLEHNLDLKLFPPQSSETTTKNTDKLIMHYLRAL